MPIFLPVPPALLDVKLRLDAGVRDWLRLGVFVENDERTERNDAYWAARKLSEETGVRVKRPPPVPTQASGGQLRTLVRKCAEELNRPFVSVWKQKYWREGEGREVAYYEVDIPRVKNVEPLAAHLLLGATHIRDNFKGDGHEPMPMCGYVENLKSQYRFRIGDQKLYDLWIDRCRTDPVFKKVLGTDLVPEGF